MTAFELAAKLNLDTSGFSSSLTKQESNFKQFGERISSWAVAKGQVLGKLIEGAGKVALGFVKDSINESRGFDKAMSQVAATLGKSTDEIQSLSNFARQMGSTTAFTATQAAEALNYMALAGYDADKSMKMLPTVLNLAAAGNMDLARASDMVTDAQSALGLSIEETERMVDQMAKTSSKTNTSVEQLGEAFLTVGGTAKMMSKGGIDATTELSMVLGVLADNGIKGAEGGTMLRNVLLSLSSPTDKAAKKLKDLGIEVFDSSGEMRDLPLILQDINEATKDMTDQQRTDFLSEVFNKRDLKAVEALLGTDMSRWQQLFEEIGNANGAAAKMAKTQLDNLEGDITKLKSAVGEARLSLVQGLTPALRKITQNGIKWVTRLTDSFKKRGLSGALRTIQNLVGSLGYTLRASGNPALQKLGSVMIKVKDALRLAKLAFTDFPSAVKRAARIVQRQKIKIAEFFGIEDAQDASWGQIASAAVNRLVDEIKIKAGQVKVKVANLLGMTDDSGNVIDDPSDTSWGKIAGNIAEKIKGEVRKLSNSAKVKIASLLGFDDADTTTWGNIAQKILKKIKGGLRTVSSGAKIKIAGLLGIDDAEEATWGSIASKILKKIKAGFKSVESGAKIKIAGLLGIDDAEDATWGSIAQKILKKIKSGFKTVATGSKIKIASLLGIEDADEASWQDIASQILTKLKTGFGSAVETTKLKIGDILGIEDADWGTIATTINTKLTGSLDKLKLKVADIFGIENADDASWTDLGMKIVNGLSAGISRKGNFLMQLVLGKDFISEGPNKSTWLDVGKKLSGYLEEAFADGGILNALLGTTADQAVAIASFAGEFLSGFATWVKDHSDQIVDIITSIANALKEAAGPVIEALAKILTDPSIWSAVGDVLEAVLITILKTLGIIQPDKVFQPEAGPQVGEREFHGVALSKEQIDSIAMWRKLMQENPDASVLWGDQTISAQEAFENVFKSILGGNNFSQEAIDALWGESAEANDEMFAKIITDLSNASMQFTDQFTQGSTAIGDSAGVSAGKIDTLGTAAESAASKLNGINPGNGEPHAKGLNYVPYDNYLALLHRGESVLTQTQARNYREGKNNIATNEIVGALQGLRNDLNNIKLVVGRKTFGRAVVNYGGSRMSDYIGGADSRLASGYGT